MDTQENTEGGRYTCPTIMTSACSGHDNVLPSNSGSWIIFSQQKSIVESLPVPHDCNLPLRATGDMIEVDKRRCSDVCMSAKSVSQQIGTYLATHYTIIMLQTSHNPGRMKACGGRPMVGPSCVTSVGNV